ncbi:MAG: choice-of-anchor Q domain-containing protein [Dehalococcoidia bacterium]
MICKLSTGRLFFLFGLPLLVLATLIANAWFHPAQVTLAATIAVSTTLDDNTVNGNCTLREAVIAANTDTAVDACPAGSGTDLIQLVAGNYILSLPGAGENAAATGDLDITSDLTIDGFSISGTSIDGSQLDRVLEIRPGSTVIISELTVEKGDSANDGGGILNSGTLTLSNAEVDDNTAEDDGGGIFNDNTGTLTLNNSFVEDSKAERGGGIFNDNTGTLTISGSTVEDNDADIGGGVYNQGTATITDSALDDNEADLEEGGGLYNDNGGTVTIKRSAIINNESAKDGAGIFNDGTITITNTTVSKNVSGDDGGGFYNDNGATFTVISSTIVANSAEDDGGGIDFSTDDEPTLQNTLVADNTGDDCADSVISSGHNLDTDGSCGLAGTGDISDGKPLLGDLQDNGGPTLTIALLSRSEALDQVPTASCTDSGGDPLATDQRGISRPQGSACDIGAFEVDATPTARLHPTTPGSVGEYNFDFSLTDDLQVHTGVIQVIFDEDITVPDTISKEDVIIAASKITDSPTPGAVASGNEFLPLTFDPVVDIDPVQATRKMVTLRVPDMEQTGSGIGGAQGISRLGRVTVTFTARAGIRNTSEAEVSENELRAFNNGNNTDLILVEKPDDRTVTVKTEVKISLNSSDGDRDKNLRVSGQGFAPNTTLTVWLDNGVDLNGDGVIDTSDLTCVDESVAGIDLNGNGSISDIIGSADILSGTTILCDAPQTPVFFDETLLGFDVNEDGDALDVTEFDIQETDFRNNGRRDVSETDLVSVTVEEDSTFVARFLVGNHPFVIGEFDEDDAGTDLNADNRVDGEVPKNVINVRDGEGRTIGPSLTPPFELTSSLEITPDEASFGDVLVATARDFIPGGVVDEATIDGVDVDLSGLSLARKTVNANGELSLPVAVPRLGVSSGEVRLKIETSAGDSEKVDIILGDAEISVSQAEIVPNQDLTITGVGFAEGDDICIPVGKITLSNVPLQFDGASTDPACGNTGIKVTGGGTFLGTVILRDTGDDPFPIALLTPGSHELSVSDSVGTRAKLNVTIKAREFSVYPTEARPRDIVTLTGYSFPADNPDTDSPAVRIIYDCGANCTTGVTADPDLTGFFRETLRVPGDAAIPDTSVVTARILGTSTVEVVTHQVPQARVSVVPNYGVGGSPITVAGAGFRDFALVEEITIAGLGVLGGRTINTDQHGVFLAEGIIVPGLDPGTHAVEVTVGVGSLATSANTTLVIPGEGVPVPAALEGPAEGETDAVIILVDATEDDNEANGNCTLREAVIAANTDSAVDKCLAGNGADTIKFAPSASGLYRLTIEGDDEDAAATGDLDIDDDLAITGLGSASTIIDGGLLDRVFEIHARKNVVMSNLTVQNGKASGDGGGIANDGFLNLNQVVVQDNIASDDGGGISNERTLTLVDSVVTNNRAIGDDGGGINVTDSDTLTIISSVISNNVAGDDGGGLRNSGRATISKSTISGNESTGDGGDGGGLRNDGTMNITASTLSGNVAADDGGAISNENRLTLTNTTVSGNRAAGDDGGGIMNASGGKLTLIHSTVAFNTAEDDGGGIRVGNPPALRSTIVAFNTGGDCSDAVDSFDYNLDSDDSCKFDDDHDLSRVDPQLGSLEDNGGPTLTHALLASSPAVDHVRGRSCKDADGDPLTVDQRGVTRPQGSDCDAGAFELAVIEASVTGAGPILVDTTVDDNEENGNCTLREAIIAANTDAAVDGCLAGNDDDTIEFAVNGGGIYELTLEGAGEDKSATGDLDITDNLIIKGAGMDRTVIDGKGLDRVLEVGSRDEVHLSRLTIRNGAVSGDGGGIFSDGVLTLLEVAVQDNTASDDAGGIFNSRTLTLIDSRVTGNLAAGDDGGGILVTESDTLTVVNSTISDNTAADDGGALRNEGTATISGSAISGNRATGDGGDGGGIRNDGKMTITASTLSGNTAADDGGAIANEGELALTNSTVSGNTAAGDDGGGVIVADSGELTVVHSTITHNSATDDGGGIRVAGKTALKGTILANNSSSNCSDPVRSLGANIDSDGSCELSKDDDLSEVDPLLGSLQSNGGLTLTHGLLEGSPALDQIEPGNCTDEDGNNIVTDQRGVVRPQGPGCDIGALEVSGAATVPTNQGRVVLGDALANAGRLAQRQRTTKVATGMAPLGDSLVRVFSFDNVTKTWIFVDTRPGFSKANTLDQLVAGSSYWVKVATDQRNVVLNGKSRTLTCGIQNSLRENCWNQIVW